MKIYKRFLSLVLIVLTTVPTAFAAEVDFSDVPADAWYAEAVNYVSGNSIMNETSATTFNPNSPMTRAKLIQ